MFFEESILLQEVLDKIVRTVFVQNLHGNQVNLYGPYSVFAKIGAQLHG